MPNQQALKSCVYNFYKKKHEDGKHVVWNHFKIEGYSKATIYRYMNSYDQNKPLGCKAGSGRRPTLNTQNNRIKLRKMLNNRRGVSLSKASRRLGCSKSTIGRILKCFKKPILCYKRKKRPSRTPEQRFWGRRKCGRLYSKYRNHEFIIDDESYFTLSNSTLAGNNTYYSNDQKLTPGIVKYYDVAKFEKKITCMDGNLPSRGHIYLCSFWPSGKPRDLFKRVFTKALATFY